MNRIIYIFSTLFCFLLSAKAQLSNTTPTYDEIIKTYKKYSQHKIAELIEYPFKDAGRPFHLFVISIDSVFNADSLRKKNKRIILINNAIHPGEPDGVNACLQMAKEIVSGEGNWKSVLKNTVVCIIPAYNISGMLNRGSTSRVNQNGPEEYGFRGNAQNLDLNRDFIKCDSENAEFFTTVFREWKPDVFVDTHVSNGADYQYTMTLIATQKDKFHHLLSPFLKEKMLPALYSGMKDSGHEMTPYVNSIAETPDSGIAGFLETPRYSSGYTSLFNTFSFITETHMLKPFYRRVEATYRFLGLILNFVSENSERIGELRRDADMEIINRKQFSLNWKIDTSNVEKILFKGYQAKYKTSLVSGKPRLYYDRNSPFEKEIKYFNTYSPTLTVEKPYAYIIPQAWDEVIKRLERNRVKLNTLKKDTTLTVSSYYITNYETSKQPYEGHYLHSKVQVRKEQQKIQFFAGDFIIYTDQVSNCFIVETLEPQAVDSYFCWNFFDAVLQQKEHFSNYVFEEKAVELLKNDSNLKKKFELKKLEDKTFVESPSAQLNFIYMNSPHYEKSHNRYPVFRVENVLRIAVE